MPTPKQVNKHPKPQRAIALTGIAGFLGGRLLQRLTELADFDYIVCLDQKRPRIPIPNGKFYKIDLTDPSADAAIADILKKENCKTVVHLAFLNHPIHSSSYAHELEEIGTMHLLNACAECRIKKIVVASTTAVYGAHPDNPNYLTESHPLRGDLKYHFIQDKVNVEYLVSRFRELHPDTIVTVLRPCTILGPTVQNLVTQYLSHRVSMTILGYDPLMQFVHEDDVIEAFVNVLQKDVSGIFNIVGKGVLPLSAVFKITGNFKLPLRYRSATNVTNLLWFAQLSPAPGAHLDYLRYLWIADGSLAEKTFGFVPHYSSRETVESFARNLRLKRAL